MEVNIMPFDGIVTKAVVEELQNQLTTGRLNKIYQPSETELVFTIRSQRQNFSLLFSIHPNYARLHLTNQSFQNPDEPPMFCMLLRKHLQGATIKEIEQYDLERIIYIHFNARNEIGDAITKTLVVELMGKHSNILLLNENKEKIINCMKHVPPSQNRFRTLLPGADYKLPPSQNKLNLLELDEIDFIKKIDFNAGKIDRQIVNILTGVSPRLAKELVHRAHLGNEKVFQETFRSIQLEIKEQKYRPAIYENKREDFHVIDMTHMDNVKSSFTTVNELIDSFYADKADRDRVQQLARDLHRKVKNELEKNKRKLHIHQTTIEKSNRADHYQKLGELLTAHMHLVKKGDSSVKVIDYYDPDQKEITIKLKSDQTPSENAQHYFKRYRKLSTAKIKAEKEVIKTENDIRYLEQILQYIDQARTEDIEEIREELRNQGYIKRKTKNRRKKNIKPKPEQFISSDGTTIYVGRNNLQNEYVTHRIANKNDFWLHTLNIPGSHVIIKSNDPSEQTIHEAAQLAAYYSKARQSASVPVDYTEVKNVKKPSGAKPGFVTYDGQKTLYVTPDIKIIQQLSKMN